MFRVLKFTKKNMSKKNIAAVLTVGLLVIMAALYSNLHGNFDILTWVVLSEGILILCILILYFSQLAVIKDVNEKKNQTLSLLRTRLAAMEASRDGIGVIDENGDITYVNHALLSLHGIEDNNSKQLLGKKWSSLYLHNGGGEVSLHALPQLQESGFWRGEVQVHNGDNQYLDADLCLTGLDDGGFIAVLRDVTERNTAEAKRQDLETQFFQAQKMEAIGRLAGGIAHDFNNILAAMNGYADFLIEDLDEGTPQHKFAASILQAGQQARDLVDQMLAFSRTGDSEVERFDLLETLKETLSMLSATLPKQIEIEENIELESAIIQGNVSKISQVIMNLCVNAGDAMEEDYGVLGVSLQKIDNKFLEELGILVDVMPSDNTVPMIRFEEFESERIRMSLGQLERGKSYLSLEVSDTGTGMSRLILERIFEPFFTTKSVDKGTGLGLATTHGVIASHGGVIVVDSTLGKGTKFRVILPIAYTELKDISNNMEGSAIFGEGKLLIVDDNDSVRAVMGKMLERLGYDVLQCASGLEALDYLRENPDEINLILTDFNMPKMTGLEFVEEVFMDFPKMPFIILSGYSEEKLKGVMQEHPSIKAVLRKPISKETISHKLHDILSGEA